MYIFNRQTIRGYSYTLCSGEESSKEENGGGCVLTRCGYARTPLGQQGREVLGHGQMLWLPSYPTLVHTMTNMAFFMAWK